MYLLAGLVIGSVIGFMLAWFLFSWLAATPEGETEYYSQSGSSKDGDLTDAVFTSITCADRHAREAEELARE